MSSKVNNNQSECDAQRAEWRADDAAQLNDDVKKLMAEPWGRRIYMRVVMDLAAVYGKDRSMDYGALAAGAGRRAVGLDFIRDVNGAAAELAVKAMGERAARDRQREDDIAKLRGMGEGGLRR